MQELLASPQLVFYTKEWCHLGTKSDMVYPISFRTNIPKKVLEGADFRKESVAERMSWAANRQTSRVEDAAYYLMGLFGINMPLIYGEVEKAFIRLQQEIIKESDDLSIFSWVDPTASFSTYRGLLASSVSHFAACSGTQWRSPPDTNMTFKSTNKGIKIPLQMKTLKAELTPGDCSRTAVLRGVLMNGIPADQNVAIHITKVSRDQYARISPYRIAIVGISDLEPRVGAEYPHHKLYFRQSIVLGDERLSDFRAGGIIWRTSGGVELVTVTASPVGITCDKTRQGVMFPGCGTGRRTHFKFRVMSQESISCTVNTSESWMQKLLIITSTTEITSLGKSRYLLTYSFCRDQDSLDIFRMDFARGLIGDRWMFVLRIIKVTTQEATQIREGRRLLQRSEQT